MAAPPAAASTEQDMHALTTLALRLVQDRNVTQRHLFEAIRSALTGAAKGLPRIPMLCGSRGVFNLSGYFKEYAAQRGHASAAEYSDSPEARAALGRLVPEFGEHIMQQYPNLADLVATYKHTNARQVMRLAQDLARQRNSIAIIDENLRGLDQHLSFMEALGSPILTGRGTIRASLGAGHYKPSESNLRDSHPCWGVYHIDDLKAFRASLDVDAVKSHQVQAIEEITSSELWQSLPTEVADAAMQHVKQNGHAKRERERNLCRWQDSLSTFMDTVVESGPECPSVWQQQRFFINQDTLGFLACAKKHDYPPSVYAYFAGQQSNRVGDNQGFQVDLQADEVVNEDAGECLWGDASIPNSSLRVTMGLLAASGCGCKLAIAHAPPFVECRIEYDYDGCESIVVV